MLRLAALLLFAVAATAADKPNVIIIFADDLGYGDLGVYGHPTIHTPHLDRMAREGQRWTSFYVGASVCTPSRGALLTGRLPARLGLSGVPRVFDDRSLSGMSPDEITLAEILKEQGYATAHVGKWHLGHHPPYMPTKQGFDEYFGLISSNDHNKQYERGLGRKPVFTPESWMWGVPLIENEEVIEQPARQELLTKRYAERAVDFIERNQDGPFFLYLAHSMPHTPIFRSDDFVDHSLRGRYGDVIEEIDWSAGQVLDAVRRLGIAENTLVLFSSDNGPWLPFRDHGGSAGPLRLGKGSSWEGGQRVPGIFWWPSHIKPAVIRGIGSTLDIVPTVAALVGADLPGDRTYDGYDLAPVLFDGKSSPRDEMWFYREGRLYAARIGPWKAHFLTKPGYADDPPARNANDPAASQSMDVLEHDPPLLFHLAEDPGELYNVAEAHRDVIERINARVQQHQTSITVEPPLMANRKPGPTGLFLTKKSAARQ